MRTNAEIWDRVFDAYIDRGVTPKAAAVAACDSVRLRADAQGRGFAALAATDDKGEEAHDAHAPR
jgi:hypothetical protein